MIDEKCNKVRIGIGLVDNLITATYDSEKRWYIIYLIFKIFTLMRQKDILGQE